MWNLLFWNITFRDELRNNKIFGLIDLEARARSSLWEWLQDTFGAAAGAKEVIQEGSCHSLLTKEAHRDTDYWVSETISHYRKSLRNYQLDTQEELTVILSAHFAGACVISCFHPPPKQNREQLPSGLAGSGPSCHLYSLPEELKKAAACKPGNFQPFCDLLEGLELCASWGTQEQ